MPLLAKGQNIEPRIARGRIIMSGDLIGPRVRVFGLDCTGMIRGCYGGASCEVLERERSCSVLRKKRVQPLEAGFGEEVSWGEGAV